MVNSKTMNCSDFPKNLIVMTKMIILGFELEGVASTKAWEQAESICPMNAPV